MKRKIASQAKTGSEDDQPSPQLVDELSGRVFDLSLANAIPALYGRTDRMKLYLQLGGIPLAEELRVPYRRIAVYQINSIAELAQACQIIREGGDSGYEYLFRGQNTLYTTDWNDLRPAESFERFYGEPVREPSFLASFFRKDFDEVTIRSIWHNQISMMMHDVAVDLDSRLDSESSLAHRHDAWRVQFGPHMDFFALGMAQHYGLPSIGLDLTDKPHIAAWFALHQIHVDAGKASVSRVDDGMSSTVFVFRCPENTVFSHEPVRPVHHPQGRPERQSAWFGHVGWGLAKNQLANYLVCAFRLSPQMAKEIPEETARYMFPKREDDPCLDALLNQQDNPKFEGEVKRALEMLYDVV